MHFVYHSQQRSFYSHLRSAPCCYKGLNASSRTLMECKYNCTLLSPAAVKPCAPPAQGWALFRPAAHTQPPSGRTHVPFIPPCSGMVPCSGSALWPAVAHVTQRHHCLPAASLLKLYQSIATCNGSGVCWPRRYANTSSGFKSCSWGASSVALHYCTSEDKPKHSLTDYFRLSIKAQNQTSPKQ